MIANDFHEHCRAVAPWADWANTVGHDMRGDPHSEARGVPDGWGTFLGFPTEAFPVGAFYRVRLTGGLRPFELGVPLLIVNHAAGFPASSRTR